MSMTHRRFDRTGQPLGDRDSSFDGQGEKSQTDIPGFEPLLFSSGSCGDVVLMDPGMLGASCNL